MMDKYELIWNEHTQGLYPSPTWEAEAWPGNDWYVVTGAPGHTVLEALVADMQYRFEFQGEDSQDRAFTRADELYISAQSV